MLPFSELIGHRLEADGRFEFRVGDLAVDLKTPEGLVTAGLVRPKTGGPKACPWDRVRVDRSARRLRLEGDGFSGLPEEQVGQLVLLKRDILDALVIDLANRRAARANDLWLGASGGRWRLVGVELGPRAVLRRVSRGLLGRGPGSGLVPWEDIELLRGDPAAARAGRDYHRQLARLSPGEIARLLVLLPYIHAAEALTLLPESKAADVFEAMGLQRQVQVADELGRETLGRLLSLMAPNLAAAFLRRLDLAQARELLEALPKERAVRVEQLLRYPADTAGG